MIVWDPLFELPEWRYMIVRHPLFELPEWRYMIVRHPLFELREWRYMIVRDPLFDRTQTESGAQGHKWRGQGEGGAAHDPGEGAVGVQWTSQDWDGISLRFAGETGLHDGGLSRGGLTGQTSVKMEDSDSEDDTPLVSELFVLSRKH